MSTSATPSEEQVELPLAIPAESSAVPVAPAFEDSALSAPRLSALGKRIEMLRVDRGLSKQMLAKSAGTSRQQLWRVMTGKSDLTATLSQRLASVLDVDSRTLSSSMLDELPQAPEALPARWSETLVPPSSLAAYLERSSLIVRTLRTLPGGEDGVALKCALLNCLEERARASRLALPGWLFRLRGSVLDGTL